jgi:hypothetical protein
MGMVLLRKIKLHQLSALAQYARGSFSIYSHGGVIKVAVQICRPAAGLSASFFGNCCALHECCRSGRMPSPLRAIRVAIYISVPLNGVLQESSKIVLNPRPLSPICFVWFPAFAAHPRRLSIWEL